MKTKFEFVDGKGYNKEPIKVVKVTTTDHISLEEAEEKYPEDIKKLKEEVNERSSR